jgi:hypothetical protein
MVALCAVLAFGPLWVRVIAPPTVMGVPPPVGVTVNETVPVGAPVSGPGLVAVTVAV